MNKKEVLEILETIEFAFNNTFTRGKDNKEEALLKVVNVWHKFLKDYEFSIVEKNLESYILYNKFPPVVSDLIKKQEHKERYIPTREETWELLDRMDQEAEAARNDPELAEKREKAQAEIRKILGIKRD